MEIASYLNSVFTDDSLKGMEDILDGSVDLVIANPPYGLGKDYGNDYDKQSPARFMKWTKEWLDIVIRKLKPSGSMYIFTTWRNSPEIFTYLKRKMIMLNEIIGDRRVPSIRGSTKRLVRFMTPSVFLPNQRINTLI